LIVAIESIKHANKVQYTLKKFCENLKENGQLIIVEDYLSASHKNHALTKNFSNVWNVPIVYTEDEFENYCEQAQLKCVKSIDLSAFINKKNGFLSQLKLWLLQIYSLFIRNSKRQTQLNIYKGALIMDYFYAKKIFKYKLKVLSKG